MALPALGLTDPGPSTPGLPASGSLGLLGLGFRATERVQGLGGPKLGAFLEG